MLELRLWPLRAEELDIIDAAGARETATTDSGAESWLLLLLKLRRC